MSGLPLYLIYVELNIKIPGSSFGAVDENYLEMIASRPRTGPEETVDIMMRAYKGWGLKIPRDKVKAGVYTRGYDKLTFDEDVLTDTDNFAQIMYDIKKIKFLPDFKKHLRPEFTKKALGQN